METRKQQLGPDHLRRLDEQLQAAKSLYDEKIPEAVLTSVSLPSVDAIEMPGVFNRRNFKPEVKQDADGVDGVGGNGVNGVDVDAVKVPFQFSAINGSFADIHASITTQVGMGEGWVDGWKMGEG